MIYIPGRNPTIEGLRSEHKITKLFLEEGMNQDAKIKEMLSLAESKHVPVQEVSRNQLDKLSAGEHHQGVVAETNIEPGSFSKEILRNNPGFYIYIREALYEHNVGAIIRTAEAAGLAGVIITPKQELTSTIARMSMGAIFHIPVYSGSLFPTLKIFKEEGMTITGIEVNGTKSIYEGDLKSDGLLIVGGEDRSLSPEVAERCNQLVFIPQYGKINSLNMSVAAAVAIYEHIRQQLR